MVTATSRFLTRFANSIRSLTKSSTIDQSANQTLGSGVVKIQTKSDDSSSVAPKASTSNLARSPRLNVTYSEKPDEIKEPEALKEQEFQLPMQLISVFDGPITDETTSQTGADEMPANLASVFTPITNLEKDLQTNLIALTEIDYSENNSDDEENDQRSPETRKKKKFTLEKCEDEDDEESPANYVKNFGKTSGATPNSILKTSRYFSYRSSLTNRYEFILYIMFI